MSYFTLELENGDIVFDPNNRLQTIEDIAQSYKVLFETQLESDFRDTSYGLDIQGIVQSDYARKEDLIEMYVKTTAFQHPMTKQIVSIDVTKQDRKAIVNITILLKTEEELQITGVQINV